MKEKMDWTSITSTEGKVVVTNRVIGAARQRCLRCKQCDVNDLKWKLQVRIVDGVDVWELYCPVLGVRIRQRSFERLLKRTSKGA